MTGTFTDRLMEAIRRVHSPVCVGLDPRAEQLPSALRPGGSCSMPEVGAAYTKFCTEVVDAIASQVPAVKIQAAFFEELGPPGAEAMAEVISHAQRRDLLVIVDGKRNDIGSTALAYARGYLGRGTSAWNADALTVSPYLGDDSLTPFVEVASERAAGIFVLVKTSNPGGGMLQDLTCDGKPLYEHVASHVESLSVASQGQCGYGAVGAVVGATFPEQLVALRQQMPHACLLVPGYGSQGGTAEDVIAAFDTRGLGAVVNNSRGIIFAYRQGMYAERFGEAKWQDAVAEATRQMNQDLMAAGWRLSE